MKKPNFFIIGAPKCGTSSLAAWLTEHPAVFMPAIKEPCYFNSDFRIAGRLTDTEYAELFSEAGIGHKAIGEASTDYLRSTVAVRRIRESSPEAKFIVCVRNPIDMSVSLHGQRLHEARETVQDFWRAWELQDDRRHGRNLPATCMEPKDILYGDACRLGEQIEALYQQVNAADVLIVVLDDMQENPKREYQRVLRFLGLEDDDREDFAPRNTARQLALPIASSLRTIALLKQSLRIRKGFGLLQAMHRTFSRERVPPPLLPERKAILREYFRPDVEKLGQMLHRDFINWLA